MDAVETLSKTGFDYANENARDRTHLTTKAGLTAPSDGGSLSGQMLDRLKLPSALLQANTRTRVQDKSIEAELRRIEMHERLLSANQLELEKRIGSKTLGKDSASLVGRQFTFSGKSLLCVDPS